MCQIDLYLEMVHVLFPIKVTCQSELLSWLWLFPADIILFKCKVALIWRKIFIFESFIPHLYFSAFGPNAKRYCVSLPIQSECRKMWTRITPNTDTFYAVIFVHIFERLRWYWTDFYPVRCAFRRNTFSTSIS